MPLSLATHLSTYHDGRYLLIDVGGCLASRGCPDSLFLTARLSQEFGLPGAEGGLGPIDAAARIARAVQRWWAADPSGQSAVILVAEPLQRAQILAATVLHFAHSLAAAAAGCCASIHILVVILVSPAAFALAFAAASDWCAASDSSARDLSEEKKPSPPLLAALVAWSRRLRW